MQIRIRETSEVMLWSEFRDLLLAQNPSELITVAPQTEEWLNAKGADVVFEGPQAQPTRYQVSFRDGVEQIDGQWFTKYSVVDMDQEARDALDAQHASNQRAERNRRLAETDWRFRTDMNPSQAWIDYCQALRDVTAQAGFPWEVQWPERPA